LNPDNQPWFDAYYFAHGCGDPYQRNELWLNLFRGFAEFIVRDIQPKTVLDAGCASGFLVECLRERGVEAWGLDISEYAIQNVHESIKPYCWVGSITDETSFAPLPAGCSLPASYDLIVSVEVFEHIPLQETDLAIANLTRLSDDILFSSTPFDYKEATHFNVQPPEYWVEFFARYGYFRDVDFDASFLTPWAVRLRRKSEPVHRLVREYERKYWQLWKENTDLRLAALEARDQLAKDEKRLDEKEAAIDSANNQVHTLEHQLNAIRSSRTWRLLDRLNRIRRKFRINIGQ
jgi:SAM-dependent methyltransferase